MSPEQGLCNNPEGKEECLRIARLEGRLDHVEKNLESITTNISKLVDITMEQATLRSDLCHIKKEGTDHEKRIRELDRLLNQKHLLFVWGERIIWLVVIAGLSYGLFSYSN